MNYWLIIIPFVSAFIGWIAGYIGIKILFRPREAKKIFGITFHGHFPKSQQQFAEKAGKLLGRNLLSFTDIEKKISDPENIKKIMPVIENHVDDFLRLRLKNEIPMLSMFIGDKTVASLKIVFMKEIELMFPQVMTQLAGNLKTEFDIKTVVAKKIAGISPDKLEKTLYQLLSKEFRFVKIMAAVIGFIIGVVQIVITLLIT